MASPILSRSSVSRGSRSRGPGRFPPEHFPRLEVSPGVNVDQCRPMAVAGRIVETVSRDTFSGSPDDESYLRAALASSFNGY